MTKSDGRNSISQQIYFHFKIFFISFRLILLNETVDKTPLVQSPNSSHQIQFILVQKQKKVRKYEMLSAKSFNQMAPHSFYLKEQFQSACAAFLHSLTHLQTQAHPLFINLIYVCVRMTFHSTVVRTHPTSCQQTHAHLRTHL